MYITPKMLTITTGGTFGKRHHLYFTKDYRTRRWLANSLSSCSLISYWAIIALQRTVVHLIRRYTNSRHGAFLHACHPKWSTLPLKLPGCLSSAWPLKRRLRLRLRRWGFLSLSSVIAKFYDEPSQSLTILLAVWCVEQNSFKWKGLLNGWKILPSRDWNNNSANYI